MGYDNESHYGVEEEYKMEWAVYHNGGRCSKFYANKADAYEHLRKLLEVDKKRAEEKKGIKGMVFEVKEGYNGFVRMEAVYDPENDKIVNTIDIIEIDCR